MRPQVQLWNKGRVSNLWWMVPIIVWLRLFLWFHTQYAVQCIFWVVSECVGRLFFSGSGPELFVCSSLWLGLSIMVLLVAVPVLQRFLSEMCQDLAPNFSFVLKKPTSMSVSCTSYQQRMSGSGRRMLDVVLESSACVQVCIWTYIRKKSHPWEHSLQAHGGFFQIGAHCRLFVLHWLDTVIRNCNASQQLRAPVSFFIGFTLPNICRKG